MSKAENEGARMQGGHVVMFPFPASGHIAPFIPFARSLASYGVAITFLYPTHEFSKVKTLVEDESFDARENVKLVSFDVPLASFNASVVEDLKRFMYANVEKFDRIVGRFIGESRTIQYPLQCESGPPTCIVSDMFLGFTQGTAEKFNIQRYCLFTSPVHFLSLVLHLPKFTAEGLIPVTGDSSPLKIPNFPPIPPRDLPTSQQRDVGDPDSYLFLLNEANQLFKAAGVLVNSVAELEQAVISGLQHCANEILPPGHKLPKILTVGPLLEGLGDGKTSLLQKLREKPFEAECFDWLNQQPDSSVLYICFGSVAMVSTSQIREMAIALENSQQRFFWVLRIPHDASVSDLFPEGFQERTKNKGLVYFDWAPQLQILAHKAIRGFVSHCGWNSAVESISLGVPMIAWPNQAEQMMNATMLDQVLGVAIRINTAGGSEEGDLISSDTFERAIRTLMVEPAGETMKAKVGKVSGVIEKALRPGGSSRTNLETFVHDVRRRLASTKGE